MAKALEALQFAQVGTQAALGTSVAATEILLPNGYSINYTDKVFHRPESDQAKLALHVEAPVQIRSIVDDSNFTGDLYDGIALEMLDCAVRGYITPTQPDAGTRPNEYLHSYAPNMTQPNTPDNLSTGIQLKTIQVGDNVQDYVIRDVFATNLEISGNAGEVVTYTWGWTGSTITEQARTGGLTKQTPAYFATNNASVYIDTTAFADVGTTQYPCTVRSFSVTFEPMFSELEGASGDLPFCGLTEQRKTLAMSFETYRGDGAASSETIKDYWDNQTIMYVRLRLQSQGEMDAGQNNPPYINIDAAMRVAEKPEISEQDGQIIETYQLIAYYDAVQANFMSIGVGTTIST